MEKNVYLKVCVSEKGEGELGYDKLQGEINYRTGCT